MSARRWLSVLLIVAAARSVDAQPDPIRPGDTISLTVVAQPNLTNKYVVQGNGSITVPLIGEVAAAGLTAEQLTSDLEQRLSRFLNDPRVDVGVERSPQIFVFGEVLHPGPLLLTANMTLLEALSRAGFNGATEVVVVRPQRSRGPALQDDPLAETIRANLMDLERDVQAGDLTRNVILKDGDTIYVPRQNPNEIHVIGEVRQPGDYAVPEGTTVLQAITLAGGATTDASLSRIRLSRFDASGQESVAAGLSDDVRPGDTVVVPKRIPLPAVDFGTARDREDHRGEIRVGSALTLRPAAVIRQIGFDSNVFNEAGDRKTDFTFVAGPELEARIDVARLSVTAAYNVDFVYFHTFRSERSIDRGAGVTVEFKPSTRFRVSSGITFLNTSKRINSVVDARVPHHDQTIDAGFVLQPWRRLDVEVTGQNFYRDFDQGAIYQGVDLGDTLTERILTAAVTTRLKVTPVTTLVFSASHSTHRFPRFKEKDADATTFLVGTTFNASALSGDLRVGHLSYLGLDPATPDLRGPIGLADLNWAVRERTLLGAKVERTSGDSFQPEFSYSIIDRAGGSIRQGLFDRFDVLLEGYREVFNLKAFATPTTVGPHHDSSENTRRYTSEFGTMVGPMRVAFNVTYVQRLSTTDGFRNYGATRMTANVSYGAFYARGQ